MKPYQHTIRRYFGERQTSIIYSGQYAKLACESEYLETTLDTCWCSAEGILISAFAVPNAQGISSAEWLTDRQVGRQIDWQLITKSIILWKDCKRSASNVKECGSTDRHRPKNKLERKELFFFFFFFFSRKAFFEADVLGLKGVVNCLLPQHALYSVRDAFTCPDPLKTHLNLFLFFVFVLFLSLVCVRRVLWAKCKWLLQD